MNYETFILLDYVDTPSFTVEYSAPIKGAGYNLRDSLHTFTYELEEFTGILGLQGTLEVSPTEDDWVDIVETEFVTDGSTELASDSFEGNFVWIRAKYQVDSGIIHRIRCNI